MSNGRRVASSSNFDRSASAVPTTKDHQCRVRLYKQPTKQLDDLINHQIKIEWDRDAAFTPRNLRLFWRSVPVVAPHNVHEKWVRDTEGEDLKKLAWLEAFFHRLIQEDVEQKTKYRTSDGCWEEPISDRKLISKRFLPNFSRGRGAETTVSLADEPLRSKGNKRMLSAKWEHFFDVSDADHRNAGGVYFAQLDIIDAGEHSSTPQGSPMPMSFCFTTSFKTEVYTIEMSLNEADPDRDIFGSLGAKRLRSWKQSVTATNTAISLLRVFLNKF